MKSTKRVRWIKHVLLNLETSPHPEFASGVNLKSILDLAKTKLDSGELLQRALPKDALPPRTHVKVVDLNLSECGEFATVLFRLFDREAPDAVYEDIGNGDISAHPKTATQGNRTTAHLVIALKSTPKGNSQRFNAVVEAVPGINVAMIEGRLTSITKRCGKGAGVIDGQSVNFHCRIRVNPYVERTIAQELKAGALTSFVLTHSVDEKKGFDSKSLIKRDKHKLEIKVVADDKASKIYDIWKSVKGIATKENFELVRAYYDRADGQPASTEISLVREDALEDLVTKVESIKLDYDFNPDHTEVDRKFAALLFARIQGK